ncbi:hypothetical protein [Streptomyces sp. NPDC056463]
MRTTYICERETRARRSMAGRWTLFHVVLVSSFASSASATRT